MSTVLETAGKLIGRKLSSFFGKRVSYCYFMLDAKSTQTRHELDHITKLCESQQYKSVIEKVYKYDEVVDMWNTSIAGRTKGKLVIAINNLDHNTNTSTQ